MFIRVVLLPLHISPVLKRHLELSYDQYKSESADDDSMSICTGLVLVPAGPGIVRKIGVFNHLHPDEIKDYVE